MRAVRFLRASLLVLLAAGVATALYHARLLDEALVRQLMVQAGDMDIDLVAPSMELIAADVLPAVNRELTS